MLCRPLRLRELGILGGGAENGGPESWREVRGRTTSRVIDDETVGGLSHRREGYLN